MLVKPQNTSPARIKVVGIGGGGGNAINNMASNYNIQDVEFIVINTDSQALANSQGDVKLKIGEEVTRGLGSGGNPAIGRKAAEESVDLIHEHLADADMVFITAGMGGGTGTGASPVVANISKNLGALTVAIVTKPFTFEGKRRMDAALRGIEELKDKVDTLIIIPNQRLLEIIEKDISFMEAMKRVDDVLAQAVMSISDLVNQAGMINVDFADVKSIMSNAGTALMGIGSASGEDRAKEAAQMAVSSPLLELSIDGAKGVLFNVEGGNDLAMYEVDEAAKLIYDSVDSSANIIFGASINSDLKDEIRITVLATGFEMSIPRPEERRGMEARSIWGGAAGSEEDTSENQQESNVSDITRTAITDDVEDDLDTPSFMRRRKKK
ncbi:cell division protein FtsZ [Candidatus Dojkabacteria bacterium]|nr:cell division protein FtsZ [Candidatus Dojkabacteria bacterium]